MGRVSAPSLHWRPCLDWTIEFQNPASYFFFCFLACYLHFCLELIDFTPSNGQSLNNKQLIRGPPIPAGAIYLWQERHWLSAPAAINREDNVYTHQVVPCLGGEALVILGLYYE